MLISKRHPSSYGSIEISPCMEQSLAELQEILYQTGIISKEIYSNLYSVRKARNKLVHEGKMVSEEDATDLYNATNKLLQIATGQLGSEILPKVFPSKILRKVRR